LHFCSDALGHSQQRAVPAAYIYKSSPIEGNASTMRS